VKPIVIHLALPSFRRFDAVLSMSLSSATARKASAFRRFLSRRRSRFSSERDIPSERRDFFRQVAAKVYIQGLKFSQNIYLQPV
jgi:hypothetical protein